jgi:hypothetical protein
MSKIEVDTIDTQSSTTLQVGSTNTSLIKIGTSGDTVEYPAGTTFTQSGTQNVTSGGAINVKSGGSIIIDSGAAITNNGTATGFSADLTNLNATNLTSGTVPDARFPATLPAANGSALTNLNATNLGSGTVATARLGSGTASSSTFLRGDQTYATISANYGLELLATTTISNLSSLSFDSSLITDTYKTYKAVVENLRTTDDSVYLYWQLSSDNGSSYLTSGYSRMIYYIDNQGSGGSAGGDENKPGFYLNGSSALGNAGREALNSEITFFGLRSSTTNKSTFHTTIFNKTNAYPQADLGGFHYSSATVMNNLKLLPNSGNLSTGTVKFYGVR